MCIPSAHHKLGLCCMKHTVPLSLSWMFPHSKFEKFVSCVKSLCIVPPFLNFGQLVQTPMLVHKQTPQHSRASMLTARVCPPCQMKGGVYFDPSSSTTFVDHINSSMASSPRSIHYVGVRPGSAPATTFRAQQIYMHTLNEVRSGPIRAGQRYQCVPVCSPLASSVQ